MSPTLTPRSLMGHSPAKALVAGLLALTFVALPGCDAEAETEPVTPAATTLCTGWRTHMAAQCSGIPAAQLDSFATSCTTGGLDGWRDDYKTPFLACVQGLTGCSAVNDATESCMADTLVAQAGALLDETSIRTCDTSTADCRARVAAGEISGTGVVADCLVRWGECGELTNDAFWSEDRCLSVIALNDADRQAAAACVAGPCDSAATCLSDLGAINF